MAITHHHHRKPQAAGQLLLERQVGPARHEVGGINDTALAVHLAARGYTDGSRRRTLVRLAQPVEQGNGPLQDDLATLLAERGDYVLQQDATGAIDHAAQELGAPDIQGQHDLGRVCGAHGRDKALHDPPGTGDHRADDHGVSAQLQHAPGLVRGGYTALRDHGPLNGLRQPGHQVEIGAFVVRAVRRVSG